MRIRAYETSSLHLLGDFDSDYVPRVGEAIILGPTLDVGDVHLTHDQTYRVLDVVFQVPGCVHLVLDLGVDGFYLGNVVDDTVARLGNELGRGQ